MVDPNPITTPAGREGQNLPRVFIRGGDVFTNSRDVAALFEKEHRNVLQAIDTLIEQEPSLAEDPLLKFQQGGLPNFRQTPHAQFSAGAYTLPETASQQHRMFDMDRDGFSLLAMGFTGPKALKWKLAYIRAFNMMEARLNAPAADLLGDVSLEEKRLALGMVRQAQAMFGVRAARRLWTELGLPQVEADPLEVAFSASPEADPKDWRGALKHLCFAPVDHAATTLWAMVRHAAGGESGPPSSAAAAWLTSRSLMHDGRPDGWLFVSNLSPWAERHFAGTPWASCWRAALKHAAGAQRVRFRINRLQQRGVRIPLRVIAALATEV